MTVPSVKWRWWEELSEKAKEQLILITNILQ
jgi:hypothetical protein